MACQIRHQKVAGRKGNCYYVVGDQVLRVRAQGELAARVSEGVAVAVLPVGSDKPTLAQMQGFEPLPAEGAWVPAGTHPTVADPRANRAVRNLGAELQHAGLPRSSWDSLCAAADSVPGGADRTFALRCAAGLAQCPPAHRTETTARLVAHLGRVASWDDAVGTHRAVDVLALAAAKGPTVVDLCAAKLIWAEARTAAAPRVSEAAVLAARDSGQLRTVFQGTYRRHRAGWSLAGAESLIRWTTAEGNTVPPPHFVGAAPDAVTDVVLADTLDAFRTWSPSAPQLSGAVNVTPAEFDESLVERIQHQFAGGALAPGVLSIEIVEDGSFADPAVAAATASRLARLGVPAKLDDFGVAESRIEARRHVFAMVDAVKFDRELVADADAFVAKRDVLAVAVQAFADKRLVAEGAERVEEVSTLAALGVNYVQGFYFAKPATREEFTRHIDGSL